jgi:hypothetical protein
MCMHIATDGKGTALAELRQKQLRTLRMEH